MIVKMRSIGPELVDFDENFAHPKTRIDWYPSYSNYCIAVLI